MGSGASSQYGDSVKLGEPYPKVPTVSLSEDTTTTEHQDVRYQGLSESDREEVMRAMESARSQMMRRLPVAAMRKLMDVGTIEEFCPGTAVSCVLLGWCLGLSGEGSVEVPPSAATASVELARLRKFDSMYWKDYVPPDDSMFAPSGSNSFTANLSPGSNRSPSPERRRTPQGTMAKLEPRVRVLGKTPLRLVRFREDPKKFISSMRGTQSEGIKFQPGLGNWLPTTPSGHADRDLGCLGDNLALLWLCTTPPRGGLAEQRSALRAQFLAALWSPLMDELEEHKSEIKNRQLKGYRKHDRFPLQGRQILGIKNHVCHLTEIWYGSDRGGNCSFFYRWFIEAMGVLGVVAYPYESIPQEKSPDGWCCVVDGAARANALKGKGDDDAFYVASGGLAQRQGRSAIDNTVLRNMLLPAEARELLVGRAFRKVACKFLAVRQVLLLRKLSMHLQLDIGRLAASESSRRDHAAARAVLRAVAPAELKSLGIDRDSICWRTLSSSGTILSGYGQLSPDDQKSLWEAARRLVLHMPPAGANSPTKADIDRRLVAQADSEDVFERFVAWCRDRPGEFFEGNKMRHTFVSIAGVWSNKVVIVKRSAMERFALARYFPMYWRRAQPLWGFGSESFQVRHAGAVEHSHVRANECPYASAHGMSLSGGTHIDDNETEGRSKSKPLGNRHTGLMAELQWIRDPAANIENWFLTDIEKILQEAWQLNPHGPKDMHLPGEMQVVVGQNPKVGSSIKETQHTQLYEGSASAYPILQLRPDARYSDKLGARLDIVSVGPVTDPTSSQHVFQENVSQEITTAGDLLGELQHGTFLRISTDQPTAPQLLRFLVELRLELLQKFGGGHVIDFLVLAVPDDKGSFVILFAPIPQLLKLGDQKPDYASWANPLTGESSEAAGIEEARVDVGKGLGHFLVAKPALREQLLADGEDTLRRIWAFNRVPGIRAAIDEFIAKWPDFEQELH